MAYNEQSIEMCREILEYTELCDMDEVASMLRTLLLTIMKDAERVPVVRKPQRGGFDSTTPVPTPTSLDLWMKNAKWENKGE